MTRRAAAYEVMRVCTLAHARGERVLRRLLAASGNALAGFLEYALTPEEKVDLSASLYDVTLLNYPSAGMLWEWEKEWFERRIPQPPARLLLGAAGGGREAGFFCEGRYTVDAFEPAPVAASRCEAVVGESGRVFTARYEDLAKAVLDEDGGPLADLAGQSYDAVILGWTSLSHVLEPRERSRLMQALTVVAPGSPILASFLLNDFPQNPPPVPRSRKLGSLLGRIAAGRKDAARTVAGEYFASHAGFAHVFTKEEIKQLAMESGMEVVWEEDRRYPHVTFLPSKQRSP